jgi:hypothetical protein
MAWTASTARSKTRWGLKARQLVAVSCLLAPIVGCADDGENTDWLEPSTSASETSSSTTGASTTTIVASTSTGAVPSTTTPPGRTVLFEATSTDGWQYHAEITVPTVIAFGKDLTKVPPGRAQLSVLIKNMPHGVVANDTPGRQPPAVQAYVGFIYNVDDALLQRQHDDAVTSVPVVPEFDCTFNSGVLSDSGGAVKGGFNCVSGEFMVGSLNTSQPEFMANAIRNFDEGVLDELIAQIEKQQPVVSINLLPMGVGATCLIYVLPNNQIFASEDTDCIINQAGVL